MPLGVVVGMAAEARLARPLGRVAIGGGLPRGAEAAAERLVAEGATALLSFGLAGGLDPALKPGALVVPVAVLEHDHRMVTDEDLVRALGGATARLLLAADAPVATAGEKEDFARSSGAAAVDLESGAVARVARRHALPFAVLRAVCDPAKRSLPRAAMVALSEKGTIGPARILTALAARPWEIPAMFRLGIDATLARRTLRNAAIRFSRSLEGAL